MFVGQQDRQRRELGNAILPAPVDESAKLGAASQIGKLVGVIGLVTLDPPPEHVDLVASINPTPCCHDHRLSVPWFERHRPARRLPEGGQVRLQ